MYYKQMIIDNMGNISYIIGCQNKKTACIVNPVNQTGSYLEFLLKHDINITHIFLLPNDDNDSDLLIKLCETTKAKLYFLSESKKIYKYKRIAAYGNIFEFGNALIKIISNPDHMPCSLSIMVSDKNDTNVPSIILGPKSFFVLDSNKNKNALNKSQHFINSFFKSQHSVAAQMV